jgi:Protein of unknown function (DUF1205)/Glycosyltransferase family 28 C-terminal domain
MISVVFQKLGHPAMKILFTPLAGISHYLQVVPLAWACRAAGHEVRVAARPPIDVIIGSGLPAVPVGGGYDFVAGLAAAHHDTVAELGRAPRPEDLRTMPPETVLRLRDRRLEPHISAADDMAADLVPFVKEWRPDLMVAVPHVLAAPIAAAAAGVPMVRHLWGPDVSRYSGFPGLGQDPARWPEALRQLYQRHGVEPRADYAVANVDPCPDSMQIPDLPDRLPMRYIPYNGTGVVPDWLRRPASRPRVCVSWSTTNSPVVGPDGFMVPAILNALSSLDVEIVATLPRQDRDLLASVPDGVRLVNDLPLHLVLESCAAFVHHGGAGTMLTAVHHGVPQIVVPPVMDQVFNAARLAATGAGLSVPAETAGTAAIKSAAVTAIFEGEAMRAAAARLREEMHAQPPPAHLVRDLENLA